MVISPMLHGMNMLITQGTLEMGEVPRSALQESAMPMVIAKIPKRNIRQRGNKYCFFMIVTSFEK